MDYRIEVENQINEHDLEKLSSLINGYNKKQAGIDPEFLFISLKNGENDLVGGLKALGLCGSLYIQILCVDPTLRNQNFGTELLERAERFAREHHYSWIHLDTFSFQALPFYQKNGYEVFGEFPLSDNIKRYFLKKMVV